MNHIIILSYLLALLSGMALFIILLQFAFFSKRDIYRKALLFFTSFSSLVLCMFFQTYIELLVLDPSPIIPHTLLFISKIAVSALIVTVPYFLASLAAIKITKQLNLFKKIAVFSFLFRLTPYLLINRSVAYTKADEWTFYVHCFFLLISILYTLRFSFKNLSNIKNVRNKKLVLVNVILVTVFFVGLICDMFGNFLKDYYAFIPIIKTTPFYYLFWNIISAIFIVYYEGNFGDSDDEPELKKFFDEYKISKREQEIANLALQSYKNQEIADSLYISLPTVKTHFQNIFYKTSVKNRISLVNLIHSYR